MRPIKAVIKLIHIMRRITSGLPFLEKDRPLYAVATLPLKLQLCLIRNSEIFIVQDSQKSCNYWRYIRK